MSSKICCQCGSKYYSEDGYIMCPGCRELFGICPVKKKSNFAIILITCLAVAFSLKIAFGVFDRVPDESSPIPYDYAMVASADIAIDLTNVLSDSEREKL